MGLSHRFSRQYDLVDVVNHSGRADVFMRKGEYDRALSEYGAALKLNPSSDIVYADHSLAYWLRWRPVSST